MLRSHFLITCFDDLENIVGWDMADTITDVLEDKNYEWMNEYVYDIEKMLRQFGRHDLADELVEEI